MMSNRTARSALPDAEALELYQGVLAALSSSDIPFLVGGAYALCHHTGIVRHTKDLDVFVRPADAARCLDLLAEAGYHTEMIYSHWLGKVFSSDNFVDVIFSSGNGRCPVDEDWFAHARTAVVLGRSVPLCPPEEMLWQKAFVMERERFDGADVNHLLRTCGRRLDWQRLLDRFGDNYPVLLSHLILFRFVYPGEQDAVPCYVLRSLTERLFQDERPSNFALCRGPLLSRQQYLMDVEVWDYRDPRLPPWGRMTPEQITHWTAGNERP
jgi:hypothetical protein